MRRSSEIPSKEVVEVYTSRAVQDNCLWHSSPCTRSPSHRGAIRASLPPRELPRNRFLLGLLGLDQRPPICSGDGSTRSCSTEKCCYTEININKVPTCSPSTASLRRRRTSPSSASAAATLDNRFHMDGASPGGLTRPGEQTLASW